MSRVPPSAILFPRWIRGPFRVRYLPFGYAFSLTDVTEPHRSVAVDREESVTSVPISCPCRDVARSKVAGRTVRVPVICAARARAL